MTKSSQRSAGDASQDSITCTVGTCKESNEELVGTSCSQVTFWNRAVDSFRPQKVSEFSDGGDLHRKLKNKHIQMIALGGSVGTGLLIGSGSALRTGGPAALLIAWGLVGSMVYCVVNSLGELCVTFPVNGAFSTYATQFVDSSWGFAVGWNYALMWLIVLPLELVAAAMCIKYWNQEINPVAWVAIFYVLILVINTFDVKGYGEAEFYLTIFKVIAIVGFVILGVILVCGGGPTHDFIGARYWKKPGPFAHGIKGVATTFVTASYSMAGTEMVGLASAEVDHPHLVLPKAIRQVFWRLMFFYLFSLLFIGLLVPFNSAELLGGSSASSALPFVIAISNAKIHALPSIFNAVILVSVVSVGNSAVYGCSRTLQALGIQGLGPKWLGYIDRKGRPLAGIAVSFLFGLLCFLSAYEDQSVVFNWLLSISGLATIFSWFNIGLCHVRFRAALAHHSRSSLELVFRSALGIYGSIYAMLFLLVVLGLQFWTALFPVVLDDTRGMSKISVQHFFQNYLGAVVMLVFWLAHKLWTRSWRLYIPLSDINLDKGGRFFNSDDITEALRWDHMQYKKMPLYKRLCDYWC